MENLSKFNDYDEHILFELRTQFLLSISESRPIRYEQVIIWIDSDQNLHRLDGPAVIRSDGYSEHWINGKKQ